MGKNQIITKEQTTILGLIATSDFLRQEFYFTGGTALSAVYLQHRDSIDLDLFSPHRFDTGIITTLLTTWGQTQGFKFTTRFVEVVLICLLEFKHTTLKVDFGYYPYKRLEKGTSFLGLTTDSLLDIAVNKMQTITRRAEVKDYIDLYFLLKKFSVWDLLEGVRIKFRMKFEPFMIASDFLLVDDFTTLPRMLVPLTLKELKRFFHKEAEKLGRLATK